MSISPDPNEHVISVPVPDCEDSYQAWMLATEKAKELFPDFCEKVVLLEDVLKLESKYAVQDRAGSFVDSGFKSDRLALLNQAAQKFWSKADPNDPTTHTKNQDVIAWLIDHGYSQSLATSGASIIRPEWAATGRPQEK